MLTGGCQYGYAVQAERRGDQVVLTAKDGGGRFAPHACVRDLEMQEIGVDGQARTVWRIENSGRGWPAEGGRCERTDFPIVYGRAPEGYATIVAAEPLRPDGRYAISGSGVARYFGAFRIRADLSVERLKDRPGLGAPLTSH